MTPTASSPDTAVGPGRTITSADVYALIAQRRRIRQRIAVATVTFIGLVTTVLAVYFVAFGRQIVAMSQLRGNNFVVDWDLNWSNLRAGGETSVTYRYWSSLWTADLQAGRNVLGALTSLNHVTSLDASDMVRLRDDDFAPVAALADLKDLALSRNGGTGFGALLNTGVPVLTDGVLDHVVGLTRLRSLSLAGNRITDAGAIRLAKLPALESLDLDGTAVTDAGLDALAGLRSLKTLKVEKTQVTPKGVRRFMKKRPDVDVLCDPDPAEGAGAVEGD